MLNGNHYERNYQNAQHSTGPRSAEGKATSSFNSATHGVFSKRVLLPGDDEEAYDRLGDELTELYDPGSEHSRRLVAVLQESEWRLDRIIRNIRNLSVSIGEEQLAILEQRLPGVPTHDLRDHAYANAYRAERRLFSQLRRDEIHLLKRIADCKAELIGSSSPQADVKAGSSKRSGAKDTESEKPTKVFGHWVSPEERAEYEVHKMDGTLDEYQKTVEARWREKRRKELEEIAAKQNPPTTQ